jgi:hypothetical protein
MKFDNCCELENDVQVANRTRHSEHSIWEHDVWFVSEEKNSPFMDPASWWPNAQDGNTGPIAMLFAASFPYFFNLTLSMSSVLRSSKRSFPSDFRANVCIFSWSLQFALQSQPTGSSLICHPNNVWGKVQIMKLLVTYIHRPSVTLSLLSTNTLLSTLFLALGSPHYSCEFQQPGQN